MKIEINSKYSIGDIVQIYKVVGEYKDRIVCPLCNGRHFVKNPNYDPENYDEDYDDSKLKCPHCDEDGYIKTNYVTKRILDEEIYRIEGIHVDIGEDGNTKYLYSIRSTPKLNNRTYGYISCNEYEENLKLVENTIRLPV